MAAGARSERQALADRMLEAGPDAPTRCEGWTVRDLAAHLVLRERRPAAAVGILVGPLRGYAERVRRELAARPWPELVEELRSGPPAFLRPLDEPVNLVEMFVHHEDVRRAQPEWDVRQVDPGEERALWKRLSVLARLSRWRLPVGVTLEAPGYGRVVARPGTPHVRLVGPPGELLLFLLGRQDVARAEVIGPPDAAERLRTARLGL
jgi:uncharacterized protein (TIGR03085 family)